MQNSASLLSPLASPSAPISIHFALLLDGCLSEVVPNHARFFLVRCQPKGQLPHSRNMKRNGGYFTHQNGSTAWAATPRLEKTKRGPSLMFRPSLMCSICCCPQLMMIRSFSLSPLPLATCWGEGANPARRSQHLHLIGFTLCITNQNEA